MMAEHVVIIGEYKFWDFTPRENDVLFNVTTPEGKDVKDEDLRRLQDILNELGKWESVIRAGLSLLSDLKIVEVEVTEKPFGSELYTFRVERASADGIVNITAHLEPDERHRREAAHSNPLLPVDEIYSQIKNVPKWISLRKALKNLRTFRNEANKTT